MYDLKKMLQDTNSDVPAELMNHVSASKEMR